MSSDLRLSKSLTYLSGWVARHNGVGRNIGTYYASRGNDCAAADGDTGQDDRAVADPDIVFYDKLQSLVIIWIPDAWCEPHWFSHTLMIVVKAPYETGIICDDYKVADLTVALDRTELPDKNISSNFHPAGRVYNGSDPQAKTRTCDDIVANSVEAVD